MFVICTRKILSFTRAISMETLLNNDLISNDINTEYFDL